MNGLPIAFIGAKAVSTDVWDGPIGDVLVTLNSVVLSADDHEQISDAMNDNTLTLALLNQLIGGGNWAWWGLNESSEAAKVTFYYRDSYR